MREREGDVAIDSLDGDVFDEVAWPERARSC
jgi:hypothetical protein